MAKNSKTKVLLFSGGLDSYIVKRIEGIPNNQCLFVRMGTRENKVEETQIDTHFTGVIKTDLPIAKYALENNIIPFRNHMLVLLAAQYGNQIYCGFTAGDTTRDKDYVFKAQMEGQLNYFAGVPEKNRIQGPFTLHMPFKQHTKAQMVAGYLAAGLDGEQLIYETKSCYAGTYEGCGECRSCLRRYIAFTCASDSLGDRIRKEMDKDPLDSINAFYHDSLERGRNAQEIKEIEVCLKKM